MVKFNIFLFDFTACYHFIVPHQRGKFVTADEQTLTHCLITQSPPFVLQIIPEIQAKQNCFTSLNFLLHFCKCCFVLKTWNLLPFQFTQVMVLGPFRIC